MSDKKTAIIMEHPGGIGAGLVEAFRTVALKMRYRFSQHCFLNCCSEGGVRHG